MPILESQNHFRDIILIYSFNIMMGLWNFQSKWLLIPLGPLVIRSFLASSYTYRYSLRTSHPLNLVKHPARPSDLNQFMSNLTRSLISRSFSFAETFSSIIIHHIIKSIKRNAFPYFYKLKKNNKKKTRKNKSTVT